MTLLDHIRSFIHREARLPSRAELARLGGVSERGARAALDAYRADHPDTPRHPQARERRRWAPVSPTPAPTAYTFSAAGDTATLEAPRGRICSLDELLSTAQVDRSEWEVARYTVNSYEGFIKDEQGVAERVPLFQIKAGLVRNKAASDLLALKAETLAAITEHAPNYAPITRSPVRGGHILVLSPADAHIGKGAWAAETGEDMDIPGAVDLVRRSVEYLTAAALPLGLSEIVLVLGNDMLQVDSGHMQTYAGTQVDTAGSYRQAFAAARDLSVQLIERLSALAPVTVMMVPGNHDRDSALHLGEVLAAWFRSAPDVTVDARPVPRKYLTRGRVLLGFTHGNEERHADLPQIMAQERPGDWAEARCREWITGHFHKKGARHFMPLTEAGGVIVRVVSSLSKSDRWHALKGFLSNPAAEAFVYHPSAGLAAQFHYRPEAAGEAV